MAPEEIVEKFRGALISSECGNDALLLTDIRTYGDARVREQAEEDAKRADEDARIRDAAEMLWTVVANVSRGDWSQQSEEWQHAAARWRDNYFEALRARG